MPLSSLRAGGCEPAASALASPVGDEATNGVRLRDQDIPLRSDVAPPEDETPPRVEPTPARRNRLATASLVLGILAVVLLIPVPFASVPASILALVFGYIARRQIKQSDGMQGGSGRATAGIILGWVGLAILLVIVAIVG